LHFGGAAGNVGGNIEGAIAGTPVDKIRVSVVTRADDVEVLLLDALGKPAGACLVSVPVCVREQAFHQCPDELGVGV
jgi:hypothetical protein